MARRSPLLSALLLAGAAAAAPAAADWLVLRDGSRLETRGPWQARGAMLVFHLPNGTLSSLRAADVDLEASAAATARAAEQAEAARNAVAARQPEKRAAITITDADVARASEEVLAAAEAAVASGAPAAAEEAASGGDGATPGGAAEGESAETEASAAGRLQIAKWDRDSSSPGAVAIVGEVHNRSRDLVGSVTVTVELRDTDGGLLATADALLGARTLQPGQRTAFRATFPGVSEYSDVRFAAGGVALKVQQAPGAAPGG